MISHKKLIVPVVALLLCSIAVIGVGFAYSGSYTENAEGTDVNSYALMVDKVQTNSVPSQPLNVHFDTVKTGDNTRAYTFSTASGENNRFLSNNGNIATILATSIMLKISASEKPAIGKLTVYINDGWNDPTGFVTNIEPILQQDSFNLAAGDCVETYFPIKFTLNASAVTDENIDNLVLPSFTFTAVASTTQ